MHGNNSARTSVLKHMSVHSQKSTASDFTALAKPAEGTLQNLADGADDNRKTSLL